MEPQWFLNCVETDQCVMSLHRRCCAAATVVTMIAGISESCRDINTCRDMSPSVTRYQTITLEYLLHYDLNTVVLSQYIHRLDT